MSEAPRVVVTDLDDTLVEGDGFTLLLRMLRRRSWQRRVMLAVVTPLSWALMIVPGWRATAVSLRFWSVTVGVPVEDVDAAVREIVRRALPLGRARAGTALAEIGAHVEAGARLVVVTAGTRPLAEATCRALGVEAEIVAASWRPWGGGLGVDAWVSGSVKARAVRRFGDIAVAYGDSITDLAMLRHARERCLVAPDRSTRILARLLIAPVRILNRVA